MHTIQSETEGSFPRLLIGSRTKECELIKNGHTCSLLSLFSTHYDLLVDGSNQVFAEKPIVKPDPGSNGQGT